MTLNGRCTVFVNSLRSLFNSAFHSCVMIPKSHVNGRLLRETGFFDLIVLCIYTTVSLLRDIKLRPVCHRLIIDPTDIMTESVDLI